MNPFSATAWFWRAWRGRSVTFAALFAAALLGISVLGWFRHVLRSVGAPWYLWLLLPVVFVATLARKETEWMPDPEQRRRWSWGLILGAVIVAGAIARFAPKTATDASPPSRSNERANLR